MQAIIFSMFGVAACGFLIYVFVHFYQEIMRFKTGSAGESNLIFIGSRDPEPGLLLAPSNPHAGEERQAKTEAVMRREMLISGLLGLFGLLAPFIFVMLLTSSGTWHH